MKPDEKARKFVSSWDIGQVIKRRRKALGMSQGKLFRTIREPASRSLLIDVARLAARNN